MPLYRHLIRTILSLLAIAFLAISTTANANAQMACTFIADPGDGSDLDFGQVPRGSSVGIPITLTMTNGLDCEISNAFIEDDPPGIFNFSIDDSSLNASAAQVTVTCDPDDPTDIGFGEGILGITVREVDGGSAPPVFLEYYLFCEGVGSADLAITKGANSSTVTAGDDLIYTVTVTNNGPDDAENVVVTDTLMPGGVTIASTTTSGCDEDPGGVPTCTLGTIPASSMSSYTITATIDSTSSGGTISNSAAVESDTLDGNPGNEMAMVSTMVMPLSTNLTISKSDNIDPIVAGNTLTYTITVNNTGPGIARNVSVTDTLPAGVTFVSTNSASPISCSPSGSLVSCLLGNIPVGGSVQYTITVIVNATTLGLITNQATVTADNDPTDATATETTMVNPPTPATADLKIEKMASPNPITAGGLLTFTIMVTNNGPDAAQSVFVTDDLPAGLQFVSSNSSCSVISDGSLLCSLGSLAAGAMAQPIMITVQTPITLSGQITNTAGVSASTLDNNLGNNTAIATTQVNAPVVAESADLGLTKVANVTQIMPGDTFDYTLTVTNQGPNTAQSVTLFDALPQGLSLLSASAGCGGSNNIIRCDFGSLGVGASTSVVLTVQASADVTGTLMNTAAVGAQSPADPSPNNNLATANVGVSATPTPPITPLSLSPTDTLLPSAFVGQPYSVIFSGGGGQSPLTLSGANAPLGLSFAAGAGNQLELSGTPTQAGDFVVTVTLTDSASPPASIVRNYMLTVGAELDIRPLSLPVTQIGENFITTFMTANGIPPDSFTSSDPLPPGLTLNGNSLTGMPTQVGDFSFTIGATDAAGNQGTRDYTLSVLQAGLLILTNTLPDAVLNASYGAQVRAIGGTKPYSWRVDSALPEGIAFSNTGFFNGRPSVTGTFIVTVTVQDQTGSATSADLSLTVNSTGLVNLTPGMLPDGLLGQPYEIPILPGGGTPPYECTLVDGQLPPGLSLTGCATTISGIPTLPGVFDFTVQIRDSSTPPLTLSLSRQIRVAEQPPIPVGVPPSLNPANTVNIPVPKSAQNSPSPDLRDEALQQIAVDAFGNRYVVGSSYNGNSYDIRLLKLDSMNNIIFDTRFDSGGQDYGFTVAISPLDQSVYVGGFTLQGAVYQALLLKYDIAGILLWQQRNGNGSPTNTFYDIAVDRSGVYAVGERFAANNFDGLIAKYDHNGMLLWESLRATGDTETGNRVAAVPCADNPNTTCTIIAGGIEGIGGPRGWLARLDPSNGAISLDQVLPTTPVEGLALAGDDIIVGGLDAVVAWRITRVDQNFQQIWTTQYLPGEVLRALTLDREGFIYAAGRGLGNGDDGLLILLDSSGVLQGEFRFDEGMDERFSDVVVGPAGQLTVAGDRSNAQGTLFLLLNLDNGKAF